MKAVLHIDKQGGIKENTLSFLPRKRERVKMIDYYLKSGAKVASFNEVSKGIGDYLLQFNNLRI